VPMYEYQCSACDATFAELIRAPGDERKLVCPQCGAAKPVRRPSVFAARVAPGKQHSAPPGGCGHCGAAGSCPLAE
jgi:putative FmdB family regulatory protein